MKSTMKKVIANTGRKLLRTNICNRLIITIINRHLPLYKLHRPAKSERKITKNFLTDSNIAEKMSQLFTEISFNYSYNAYICRKYSHIPETEK